MTEKYNFCVIYQNVFCFFHFKNVFSLKFMLEIKQYVVFEDQIGSKSDFRVNLQICTSIIGQCAVT